MKDRLKICFIGKYSFLTHKGGIETFSKCLLENLRFESVALFFNKKRKIFKKGKISIVHIPQIFNFLGAPFNFLPFNLIMKTSIVHLNIPNPLVEIQLLFYFLIRGKKQKLLITYHAEAPHYTIFHWFFDFLRMFWHIPLLIISDRIIATTKEYLRGSFILRHFEHKVDIINLGLDFKRFENFERSDVLRKKLRIKKDEKVILFLGRVFPYKGLDYLLQAFKILAAEEKRLKLIIAGRGRLLVKLKKLASKLNISRKTIFLGEVSEKEKNGLYRLCDIFVLPSINKGEAFGLSMLEAMYFEKPVVSTKIRGSGVNFVNLDGITGLTVEPKNPKDLAEAMKKILEDKKLRKKLGRNARLRVLKLFGVRRMVRKYERIYENLSNKSLKL